MDQPALPEAEKQALVQHIANELGESYPFPIRCIERIVEYLGAEFAQNVLQETLEIEAQGGMLLPNRRRKRTPGGVYFHLIRNRVDPEMENRLFQKDENPYWRPPGNVVYLGEGKARQVEISIKGRPGPIERREKTAIMMIDHAMDIIPNLPQGVPMPPKELIQYKVYMSVKQWDAAEGYLHVPEDELIITGIFGKDPDGEGMAVFAMSVSTRQREWRLRKDQEAESGMELPPKREPREKKKQFNKGDKRDKGKGKEAKERGQQQKQAPAPSEPAPPPKNSRMPADIAQKLDELRSAAALYRQQVAAIEAKPKSEQGGLQMRVRLLQSTEMQIKSIEAQYPPGE